MNWNGVMPAITTCFNQDLSVDHPFVAEHCRWLLDNGCTGIVALGSLGEGATLSFDEKLEVLRTCVKAVKGRGPVVASISALTTSEAVALAKACDRSGLRWSDGAASLCLQGRLARNENARGGGIQCHAAFLHALQQSRGLRNRFSARADPGVGGRTREF